MPTIKFVNEFQHVEVASGANLRTVARDHGVSIDREQFLGVSCKNRGLCGQCKVWIKEATPGATSPRTWKETALFFRRFKGWRRLACQVRVLGDIEVFTVAGGPDRRRLRPIDSPPSPAEHAKPVVEPPKKEEPAPAEPTT